MVLILFIFGKNTRTRNKTKSITIFKAFVKSKLRTDIFIPVVGISHNWF